MSVSRLPPNRPDILRQKNLLRIFSNKERPGFRRIETANWLNSSCADWVTLNSERFAASYNDKGC